MLKLIGGATKAQLSMWWVQIQGSENNTHNPETTEAECVYQHNNFIVFFKLKIKVDGEMWSMINQKRGNKKH